MPPQSPYPQPDEGGEGREPGQTFRQARSEGEREGDEDAGEVLAGGRDEDAEAHEAQEETGDAEEVRALLGKKGRQTTGGRYRGGRWS